MLSGIRRAEKGPRDGDHRCRKKKRPWVRERGTEKQTDGQTEPYVAYEPARQAAHIL